MSTVNPPPPPSLPISLKKKSTLKKLRDEDRLRSQSRYEKLKIYPIHLRSTEIREMLMPL